MGLSLGITLWLRDDLSWSPQSLRGMGGDETEVDGNGLHLRSAEQDNGPGSPVPNAVIEPNQWGKDNSSKKWVFVVILYP